LEGNILGRWGFKISFVQIKELATLEGLTNKKGEILNKSFKKMFFS